MIKLWEKWSYIKKGAFFGFLIWFLAVISFILGLISYKFPGMNDLEMFFIGISYYIVFLPLKIINVGLKDIDNDPGMFFGMLIMATFVSLFFYPIIGGVAGWIIGKIRNKI